MNSPKKRIYFYTLACLLLTVKLWFLTAYDLVAISAPQDDLYFVKLATHLAGGEWLGPLNQVTLSKGAFYPLFIMACYWLGIPLMVGQQLLWWLACLVFCAALFPLSKKPILFSLVFVFLLLLPSTYFFPATARVLRLNVYAPLAFLTLSCILGLLLRTRLPWKKQLIWACGAGLSFSLFWHTREESLFLLPSLLLIFLYHLICRFKTDNTLRSALSTCMLYAIPVALFFAISSGISYQNGRHYDIHATLDSRTPEFKSAYGTLLSIRTGSWRQFFPVVEEARRHAYAASPAFKELEPYLEGDVGEKWMSLGGIGDIHAAFFPWAFRDAVHSAGYYQEGVSTLDFYRRMGQELNAACDDGRLDCSLPTVSLLSGWHEEFNQLVIPTWLQIITRAVSFADFTTDTGAKLSRGPAESMVLFETITREKLQPSKRQILNNMPEYHKHLNKEKTRVLNDVSSFYRLVMPVLCPVALGCLLFSLLRSMVKRVRISPLLIVSLAALSGVLSITFILTLLTITSYDEITRALQVAYPLLVLFVITAFLDLTWWWRQQPHAPAQQANEDLFF